MEPKEGHIPLSRRFFEHEFWTEKREFSKAEAWIWLLYQARYKGEPGKKIIGRRLVVWERGQIPGSLTFLRNAWNWKSNSTVHHFLKYLERERMISIDNSQGINVITLLNHEQYNPHLYKAGGKEPPAPKPARKNHPDIAALRAQTKELVEYWNDCTGTNFRAIDSRIPQVRSRLKLFTIEQLKQAIKNRAEDVWVQKNDQQSNWDAVFKTDKAVEQWLNRSAGSGKKAGTGQNIKNPAAQGWLTKNEAVALAGKHRKEFNSSNFEKMNHQNTSWYKPLFNT